MRSTCASSAGESSRNGKTLADRRRLSAACATNRSQARAASSATRVSADRSVRSNSARLTENEREPRTAAGTTPTSANTAKILLRNCTGRDPLADLEHRARRNVAARKPGVRARVEIEGKCLLTSTALRVTRERQVFLELFLDPPQLGRRVLAGL